VGYDISSFYLRAYDNSASSNQLNYSTEDSYVQYCYIMNNYADYRECIRCFYNIHKCEESNIINNSQSDIYLGTINFYSTINVTINKCCFIKNNEYGNGKYLFYNTGTKIEVRECTIQNGYTICGVVTTSYSNTVAGSECAVISNCGTKNVNTKNDQGKCTICDFEILHKFQKLYLNKQFYYK
jgi:hypothetical protein